MINGQQTTGTEVRSPRNVVLLGRFLEGFLQICSLTREKPGYKACRCAFFRGGICDIIDGD
jgi:hypothetical protein